MAPEVADEVADDLMRWLMRWRRPTSQATLVAPEAPWTGAVAAGGGRRRCEGSWQRGTRLRDAAPALGSFGGARPNDDNRMICEAAWSVGGQSARVPCLLLQGALAHGTIPVRVDCVLNASTTLLPSALRVDCVLNASTTLLPSADAWPAHNAYARIIHPFVRAARSRTISSCMHVLGNSAAVLGEGRSQRGE